jgi:hypothetical protein
MALGTSGCLITDKATFSAPAPTPPFVNNLDPPATDILNIPRKPGTDPASHDYVETVNIAFDVRSDDMGKFLFAEVFVDYPSSDPNPIDSPPNAWSFAADIGTFDTPRRKTCTLHIPYKVVPGCHSITAIVSHAASLQQGVVPVPPPGQPADVGSGTWWAQIGVEPEKWAACPPDPPNARDAGGDARMDGGP